MSRRTALTLASALALGAGLAVLPTQAQAATVVVSNSTDLASALKNATAGTVIHARRHLLPHRHPPVDGHRRDDELSPTDRNPTVRALDPFFARRIGLDRATGLAPVGV